MRIVEVAIPHNQELSQEVEDFLWVSNILNAEHTGGSVWVHLIVRTGLEVPEEILV